MGLTSLGDRKTPSRPVEITFAPNTGLPSDLKELILIGHRGTGAASGSSGIANYSVVDISNVANLEAASGEAIADFGSGSELALMIMAAVRATESLGTHPAIKAIPLAFADVGFGTSDEALTAAKRVSGAMLVSCYAGDTATTLREKLIAAAVVMSGPERTENNQFGTFATVFARATASPASLPSPDSYNFMGFYMPDSGSPTYSVGESAAACAGRYAANGVPFNPLDNITVIGIAAPSDSSQWLTIGAGLESETVLNKGWCPMKVKANGEVAFVRTVTGRITIDGSTPATAYYDGQDFDVLFYWRKTVYTRFKQTDFTNVKANAEKAKDAKSEMIRLAQVFEDDGMFQAVSKLATQFKVQRSESDRHTFEVFTPVNVVPGLHNILTNVQAGVAFDSFVV